jgi:hypothetical protein
LLIKSLFALVLFGTLLFFTVLPANAGALVTSLAALNPNDMVNWGQFGPSGTALDGPSAPFDFSANFSNSSNGALVGTGGVVELGAASTYSIPGTMPVVDNQFSGPVDMLLLDPIQAFGFYIASAFGGAYNVTISTYDASSNLLQTYTEGGSGAPEFFGVQDSTADIKSLAISMTNGNGNNYFAFGTLYAVDALPPAAPPPVPEPSTFLLGGSALAVLIGLRRTMKKTPGGQA